MRRIGLTIAVIAAALSMAAPSNPSLAPAHGQSDGRTSALSRQLSALHLMNYFPSDAGWQYMWTRWAPGQINKDFAVMASMGANAVRITVSPEAVGFPTPSPVMQSRLEQIVGMAGGHGLEVQLSLFDQFTDFTDIADSLTWAHDLLAPLGGGSHLAFIDVRNELDAPSTMGNPQVYRWVEAVLPAVEHDAPGVPVTLSVTAPAHITALRAALQAEPDFWDLHYYSSDGLAYATMDEAIAAAAPQPVFVGETGFATAGNDTPPGLPAGEPSLEAYQAHYYQVVEQAALSLGLGAAAPWTLYDFTRAAIPSLQQPDQYAFGLLHTDGTPKPAAAVISGLFRTGDVSEDFNSDFSQAVATPEGAFPAVWRVWESGQAGFTLDSAVGHDASGSARISDSRGSDGSMPASTPSRFTADRARRPIPRDGLGPRTGGDRDNRRQRQLVQHAGRLHEWHRLRRPQPGRHGLDRTGSDGHGPAWSRLRGDLAQERRQLRRRMVRRRDLGAVDGLR